jgi:threonine dehydrogenase-like Zn-dependent dehydrogenase
MKCRSIRYTGPGKVDFVEVDVPNDPAPGEVQVERLACGICQWDVHIYKTGSSGPPGHEGIGRVVKVGRDAKNIKEGDWVTGGGLGFAEFRNCVASTLHPIPKTNRKPEHWIVEPVACVVTGLDHCRLKAGDRIALVGCGFMGLMFAQALGRRSLVDEFVAIDIDPKRLEMAKLFGATQIVDPRNADIDKLKAIGFDTVVDCSGAQAGLDLSSKIVRRGGLLNLFGWNHGTGNFPGDLWHLGGFTVVNSAPASGIRDTWPVAIRMIERGFIDLEPLVSHVVKLEEYPALLAKAASRQDGYIKGIVTSDNS